jgi:hypothetical protein
MTNSTILDEIEILGQTLTKGRQFQINGSRDRFTFLSFETPKSGDPWINCMDKKNAYRAFTVDRVRKIVPLPRKKANPE